MARSSVKRITRKDLRQPDQFVTISRTIYRLLFEEYRTQSILAAIFLLLIVLGVWGWTVHSATQIKLAAESYSRALDLYHSERYPEAVRAFGDLAENYRSTVYGRLAQIYQADAYMALNQPSLAAPVLQDLVNREKNDTFVQQLALVTLANSQEAQSQWRQAAQTFGEAEKLQGPFKENALLGKARCALNGGDLKEALASYRQYVSSYPGSDRATEVQLRIQELEAKLNEKPQAK